MVRTHKTPSQRTVYLDYAAATPLDAEVFAAMQPFFTDIFFNPSSIYSAGKHAKQALDSARHAVARQLGAKPGEILFTSGGTEANNLAITGVMGRYPDKKILVSAIEHDSVLEAAKQFNYATISVNNEGKIHAQNVATQLTDDVVLISIALANSEIGTIQPLKDIVELVHETRALRVKNGNNTPLYLHTDACQAATAVDLHVHRLGVDLMTINGGKMYGPKQSGALFVRSGIPLKPQIVGGGQEFGMRSGTENVGVAIGLGVALKKAQAARRQEIVRLQALQQQLIEGCLHISESFILNGPTKNRLPNNVHIRFTAHDNERLLFALDDLGIQCSTGSACSASKETPSHVLRAIGLSDTEARQCLRFSLGRSNTTDDIAYVISQLPHALARA